MHIHTLLSHIIVHKETCFKTADCLGILVKDQEA